MVDKQQLIVVVEGTAAIAPFWHTIVSDYLKDIVRCFCENESMDQKPSTPEVELSLVVFNAYGPYNACLVQRSGWTRDMDPFFHWLSSILFTGGGFSDAAIAEGLAEALMMLSIGNRNQNINGKRHCILVAASNPYPLPTPVYRPQTQHIDQSDDAETPSDYHLSDAEALAKSFAQCAISLSVICPKNLPKLKVIYHAGKSDPLVADPPEGNDVKNPHFLVLISDNFMEARAALITSGMLNLPSNQNSVKIEVTPVTPTTPISGPPPASVTPGMSQPMQTGIQPLTLTEIEAGKPRNVKFWEGKLSGRPKGQLVQLARIEGFRDASEPDTTLSSNWPKTLEIAGLISQDDKEKMLSVGKAETIVFQAMDEHVELLELQKKQTCCSNTVTFPAVADYIYRPTAHFDGKASPWGYGYRGMYSTSRRLWTKSSSRAIQTSRNIQTVCRRKTSPANSAAQDHQDGETPMNSRKFLDFSNRWLVPLRIKLICKFQDDLSYYLKGQTCQEVPSWVDQTHYFL